MIFQWLMKCASALPFEVAHTLLVYFVIKFDRLAMRNFSCVPEGGVIAQGFGFSYWSPWEQAYKKTGVQKKAGATWG